MHTDRDAQNNPIDEFVLERIRFRVDELIRCFGFGEDQREDLRQELILGVLEAMDNNFDAGQSPRKSFIRKVLDRRCIDLIRYQQAEGRDASHRAYSLDEVDCDHEPNETPERTRRGADGLTALEKTELTMDLEAHLPHLPERHQRVCELMRTLRIEQVAECLNVSVRTIYRNLQQAREQVKELESQEIY